MLKIADKTFRSRLILGTGKFPSFEIMREVHRISGTEMVTLAIRRVQLDAPAGQNILEFIDRSKIALLPNTAGCYTAEAAVQTARLARAALETDWIKLEVIGDEKTLLPDVSETLVAAKQLVSEGFIVLPYISDDPVACQRLEAMGCPALMPLAAPIGSGLGIRNPYNLQIILEQAKVPVIVDAGVGCASDAAYAMELGCAGLLMNSAVALAQNPALMAQAMRDAVAAGRASFEAGRIPKRLYAQASSPLQGVIGAKGF